MKIQKQQINSYLSALLVLISLLYIYLHASNHYIYRDLLGNKEVLSMIIFLILGFSSFYFSIKSLKEKNNLFKPLVFIISIFVFTFCLFIIGLGIYVTISPSGFMG